MHGTQQLLRGRCLVAAKLALFAASLVVLVPRRCVASPAFETLHNLAQHDEQLRSQPQQQRSPRSHPGATFTLGGSSGAPPLFETLSSTLSGIAGNEEKLGRSGGSTSSPSPLSFTSTNSYPQITWSPWDNIAEPYREAMLKANSTVGDVENDIFLWTLPTENGVVYEGREVTHTFTTVGRKKVILTQTEAQTGNRFYFEGYVMVKYVRREIRKLHPDDVQAFFNAMQTLYRLPTAQGVHQFGSEYKGIEFFIQMHLDGAGVLDCDHWHDDAGIMTHHVAYSLQFEQAMQLVDPSVAIPYWEYTIESANQVSSYGDSRLFDDDWFGEFSPDNELHTVTKGRWAYLSIMEDAWEYVHNPYGLLRSPWNLDSTPYVTRHNMTNGMVSQDMVSCQAYASCFSATAIARVNQCLNGGTHGPVHILIGGEWASPEEEFIQKLGYTGMVPLVSKFLWRKGYMRIPTSCTEDEECVTTCPSHLYESRDMNPYDVLMDAHALVWTARFTSGVVIYDSDEERYVIAGHEGDAKFAEDFWLKMLHSFCNVGKVGEMYTSSAPYDPLFWVIHPTADRLLGWRRMLGREQPDEWASWGYEHSDTVGETGTVCNWDDVRPDTDDMPTCVNGICGGHRKDDMLPFSVKVGGEVIQLTNLEWMDMIYPTNEDLPYMYDEYSWEHCTVGGYDLGS